MGAHNKNPQEVTDAIRRVLNGDVESYDIVHKHTDGPLRLSIAARYYWAGPDFENEIAARTHEFVLPRLGEYEKARATIRTWVNWQARGVAKQVMYEWYGRRLVQYNEAVHEVYTVSATGPVDVFEDERLSRAIEEEVASLPDDERQAVVLHDREGLTFAETAEASGQSVMQVRYRRERALARLKHRLLMRGVRPVAIDFTPAPVWHGRDWTDPDDFAAPTVAYLPDGPDTLVGAAAKSGKEDDLE